jgi:hypothetical protein
MSAEFSTNLPTNGIGSITASVMRVTFNDMLSGIVAFNGDANVIGNSLLVARAGLSVMGNASSAGANVADIAGTAGQALVVNNAGTSLGFGQVDVSNSAAVVNRLGAANFRQSAGLSIVGNGTNSTASVADITAGSPNQVLASNSGGTAVAFESLSTLIDGALGSVQGDIIYRGASVWGVLAPGTSGQLLSSGGAAANPSWITASGTGTVTNVATTYPIIGGPITATGTVAFQGAFGQGIMARSTNTAFTFLPKNGDLIKIQGAVYQIPAGGIAGTGNIASIFINGTGAQAVSPSTFYYVYAFINSGTVTADLSTTAYQVDPSATNVGVYVKTGDSSRSLIGAFYVDASSHINDSDSNRTLLSWFNRQPKRLQNAFTATRSTSSATLVEISTEIRCNFIAWADDEPCIGFLGYVTNATSTNAGMTGIGLDGGITSVTPCAVSYCSTSSGTSAAIPSTAISSISEGALHFFTVAGSSASGTITSWTNGTGLAGSTQGTLTGFLRG